MKEIIELSIKTIKLERNEILKVKGSIDTNIYYVENGSLKIHVLDEGEEQIVRLDYQGNFIESFLTNTPSDFHLKTTLKVVTKQQIDNIKITIKTRNTIISHPLSLFPKQLQLHYF